MEKFKFSEKYQVMDDFVKTKANAPLDLHHFKDIDVPSLVEEFVWACEQDGKSHGTIIHGKGTGAIREIVHTCLSENPNVFSFKLGSSLHPENWGMTTFQIRSTNK